MNLSLYLLTVLIWGTTWLAALQLSFGTAFVAAIINGIIGTVLAWVLVRYTFPGRKVIDARIPITPWCHSGSNRHRPNGMLSIVR